MKNVVLLILGTMLLVSCGGNGSGGGGYTHNELAKEFRKALNSQGESITLAKDSTLERDFAVYYDANLGDYFAIDISGFRPGMDALNYWANATHFHDLYKIGGHYEYEYDVFTDTFESVWVPTRYYADNGLVFDKNEDATSKDLEKLKAFKEIGQVKNITNYLTTQHGFSADRAKEFANISIAWEKFGKGTDAENDAYAKDLFDVTITEGMKAHKSGDVKKINELIEKAAKKNGISKEHVEDVFSTMINQ